MTSAKGPNSEFGESSPELDVLTGPPTSPDGPPPPLPRADVVADSAPQSDSSVEEAATPEPAPQPRLPVVMPAAADAGGFLDFVRIVRAEVIYESAPVGEAHVETLIAPAAPPTPPPAPETLAELATAPTSIAETVPPAPEPVLAKLPDDVSAEVAPNHIPSPPLPEPIAPPPLAEFPAQPPPAAFAAPMIASAVAAPSAVAFDLPVQPPPPLAASPPIAVPTSMPARASWRRWLRRAFLACIGLAAGYAVLVLVLIGVYRYVDPPLSTVMLGLILTGQSVDREPVPITSVSSYLQRAVIASEDARFCRHGGVDWGALAEAMQDSRGGSTITMQVAKNLFLWPSRSYVRKAIEIPVALMIDFAWPKRRILEVYLNIAEWGPGVFGAEAAAQYHFGKAASRLSLHEATLLAASLPNPIAREAGDPGRVTALLASRLRGRVANSDAYVTCLGLRPMPRAEPEPRQKPAAVPKPASKAESWQTRTEPAKPPTPFNPWQN